MEILTDEQREISKLEIQLDVCKRGKDALQYQLGEAKREAAEHSVHLTALRRWLVSSLLCNLFLLAMWALSIGGR